MKLQNKINWLMGVRFEQETLPEEPEIEPPQALYPVKTTLSDDDEHYKEVNEYGNNNC